LNSAIIYYFISELDIEKKTKNSHVFKKTYSSNTLDFRENIRIPRKMKTYQQVFNKKFESNLSILDLIFNLGPESKDYIQN